ERARELACCVASGYRAAACLPRRFEPVGSVVDEGRRADRTRAGLGAGADRRPSSTSGLLSCCERSATGDSDTHRLGVLSDEEVFRLARSRTPVDCIVGRGGVLMMRPLIIHSSTKARLDQPRRVRHIEYADRLGLGSGVTLAVA